MTEELLDTGDMAALIGAKRGWVSRLLVKSRRKVAAGEELEPVDVPLPTAVRKGRPYWTATEGRAWKQRRDDAGVTQGGPRGGGRPPKGPDAVTVRLVVEYRGERTQVTRVSDGEGDPAQRASMLARVLAHQAAGMLPQN
ncbi:hypothetical protein FK268_12695 [Tsukamurella sputi]|uniref:Uncharacterized protein n=1 Tax=Tsukamurella sputi TaxID=2591848 RepID=A0A5C5RQK6_9ACTN|nr:hypothetical protein [Tsukamurella sputi]TWS24441.1 hypothetical protein FK268_12695 [Tsukamurella sputi]